MDLLYRYRFIAGSAALLVWLMASAAMAKPGTHGWAVSTWDTTRSTVVFNFEHGILPESGSSNILGYNANFTSTTGRLSAQFGMQYMNLTPPEVSWTMHGGAGSVVAMYGIPIGERFSNGLPRAAFTLFGGTVPTVLSNGQFTYVTVPLVFGMGIEINPIRHLSIIPWMEGAVSFSIDTIIRYEEFQSRVNEIAEGLVDDVTIIYDANGIPIDIQINDTVVDELLADVIEYEVLAAFRMRGGLSLVLNLGDRLDLQLNGTVAQVGSDFDAPPTWYVGTALAFAWDDPPLGILPEETRANTLSCKAVATRFETCAEYPNLVNKIREEEAAKHRDTRNKEIIVHVDTTPKPAEAKPESPAPVGTPAEKPADSTTAPTPPQDAPPELPAPPADDPFEESAPAVAPPPAAPASGTGRLPSLSQPIN